MESVKRKAEELTMDLQERFQVMDKGEAYEWTPERGYMSVKTSHIACEGCGDELRLALPLEPNCCPSRTDIWRWETGDFIYAQTNAEGALKAGQLLKNHMEAVILKSTQTLKRTRENDKTENADPEEQEKSRLLRDQLLENQQLVTEPPSAKLENVYQL
ncbi:hypothetical protein G9A89_018271 [Geosiphon pyriformis]|nr:hypothetical protein G9A89_018271 [Geosiphon pyriformis]